MVQYGIYDNSLVVFGYLAFGGSAPCSKRQRIMLGVIVCLLVITQLELQLVDRMTVCTLCSSPAGRTSGNGNLGLEEVQ